MAEQSEAHTVFGCSYTGIVGSNPTCMDVCLHFSLFSFVWVEALCSADHPSKESNKLPNRFMSFRKINSELEQTKRPNPWKDDYGDDDDDDDDDDEL